MSSLRILENYRYQGPRVSIPGLRSRVGSEKKWRFLCEVWVFRRGDYEELQGVGGEYRLMIVECVWCREEERREQSAEFGIVWYGLV